MLAWTCASPKPRASADRDAPAAEAALAAYSVIVAEAVQGTAGDPTADATIENSVTRHVLVLTQLAGTVPPHARGAIQNALVASSKAIRDLDGQTTPDDGRHAGGPGSWVVPRRLAPPSRPRQVRTQGRDQVPAAGARRPVERRRPTRSRMLAITTPRRRASLVGGAATAPASPPTQSTRARGRLTTRANRPPRASLRRRQRPDAPRRDRCGARIHRSAGCHRRFVPGAPGDSSVLLDLGQGSFARLAGILDPATLDAVVISHLHPDHFIDLVALRHYLRWEKPRRRVRVIGPAGLDGAARRPA